MGCENLMNETVTGTAAFNIFSGIAQRSAACSGPPSSSVEHAGRCNSDMPNAHDVIAGSVVKLPIDEPVERMAEACYASMHFHELAGDANHKIDKSHQTYTAGI